MPASIFRTFAGFDDLAFAQGAFQGLQVQTTLAEGFRDHRLKRGALVGGGVDRSRQLGYVVFLAHGSAL
jgi:hypothetical protein